MTQRNSSSILVVLVSLLVLLSGVGATTATGAQSDSANATPITECTTIDEAGAYVVTENLSGGDGPCLAIVADDVRLDGQNHGMQGLRVRSASNVTVEHFVSSGISRGFDVEVDESSHVTLRDGTVGIQWTQLGVEVRNSSDVALESLRVNEQIDDGIVYENVDSGSVQNTTVTTAADGDGDALRLRNSTGVAIENNTLRGDSGVVLVDSAENVVRRNRLTGYSPRSSDLVLDSSSDNVVTGHGVLELALDGTSEGNLIYNNGLRGWTEPVDIGPNVGENRWNGTVQRGENVLGGRFVAGNYYSTFGSNSTDYSETCTDEDGDGICDEPLELADGNVDAYPLSTNQAEANVTYYQVDLVTGDPIEELGRQRQSDYSKQGRLLRYAHGNSENGLSRHGSNLPTTDEETGECVEGEPVEVNRENGTARVRFTVEDGCEVELSLVSYEKVGPGWSIVRQQTQRVVDAETRTLGPGTHTLTVDLPDRSDETND